MQELRYEMKCGLLYDQFLDTRQLALIKELNKKLDEMNFRIPNDLATTKPVYDFACKFMCNEVALLEAQKQAFFDNFNPDEV